MKEMIAYIQNFNTTSILIRLVLAVLFGGIIGIEREQKRQNAGFRTFTLVCLGAALATITGLYLFHTTESTDTARIAAGVVSGIGFLGVGTIIITPKNQVKGLTTAAGIWVTGCLGIALGAGMVLISVFAFFLVMLTMNVLQHLSTYIASYNRILTFYAEVVREEDIDRLMNYLHEKNYKLLTLEKRKDKVSKGHFSVLMEIDLQKRIIHTDVIHEIGKLEGLFYIEEA